MATNAYVSQATSLIQLFKDALSKIQIRFAQHSALSTECSAVAIRVTFQSKKRHVDSAQLDSTGLDAHARQIKFVTQIMFGTLRQTLADLFSRSVESTKDGTVFSVCAMTFMTELMVCANCVLLGCFSMEEVSCQGKIFVLSQTKSGTEFNAFVPKVSTR